MDPSENPNRQVIRQVVSSFVRKIFANIARQVARNRVASESEDEGRTSVFEKRDKDNNRRQVRRFRSLKKQKRFL